MMPEREHTRDVLHNEIVTIKRVYCSGVAYVQYTLFCEYDTAIREVQDFWEFDELLSMSGYGKIDYQTGKYIDLMQPIDVILHDTHIRRDSYKLRVGLMQAVNGEWIKREEAQENYQARRSRNQITRPEARRLSACVELSGEQIAFMNDLYAKRYSYPDSLRQRLALAEARFRAHMPAFREPVRMIA